METIKGENVMTRAYRSDDDFRRIHAEAMKAAKAGGSVGAVFKANNMPVGTFYSNCARLGLDKYLNSYKPGAAKTRNKPRAKFIEFAPTNTGSIRVAFKGLTIECPNTQMMKDVVNSLVGEA